MKPLKVNAYLLSATEVAKRAGVSRITVGNWIREGKLKATRTGSFYLIRTSVLDAFLASRNPPPSL